jgi:hypothetical protein
MEQPFPLIAFLSKLAAAFFVLLFSCQDVDAQTTYDWTGATSSAWNVNTNWKIGSITATTAPSLATDIIRIGIGVTSFTNQPVISGNVSCAFITFGALAGGATLTVNSGVVLTVSNINVNHGSTGSSNTKYVTKLLGGGAINVTTIQVGDNQQPAASLSGTVFTQLSSQLTLTIAGNLILNSVGNNSAGVNWCEFDLDAGTTILDGQIITQNVNTFSATQATLTVAIRGKFSADNNANATTLILNNNNAVQLPIADGQVVDFTNNGSGSCTIVYNSNSGSQFVYTGLTDRIGRGANVYENLTLQGASTKVTGGNYSALPNNLGIDVGGTLTTQDGPVDMVTNGSNFNIDGSWTNSATVTQGSGTIWVGGSLTNNSPGVLNLGTGALNITGNYTNSATFTAGSGLVTFNGGSAETLTDAGNGTTFNNVTFTGGGTKTINSGNFAVSSSGILTMSVSGTTLAAGNKLFTLLSDATGSAAVAAIPSGCLISGTVNIQRYLTGDNSNSYRNYRLLSSPVNLTSATSGLNNYISLAYLNANFTVGATTYHGAFTGGAGGTGNGFNLANNNPTVYFYKESVPVSNVSFTSGKHVGVTKVSAATVDLSDGSTGKNIPVGNAYILYYIGPNTRTDGSTGVTPGNATLTASGFLNQGSITVNLWYAPAGGASGQLSYNSALTLAQGGPGYNMAGNPYACPLNLKQVITDNPGIDAVYLLNPTGATQSYTAYTANGSSAPNLGYAVSGGGFIVHTTGTAKTLTFKESEKAATQVLTGVLMGKPISEPGLSGLYMKLEQDSLNYDYCGIYFRGDWSDQSEAGDATDMSGTSPQINISSLSADGKLMSVNHLSSYTNGRRVRLYTNVKSDGAYFLRIEGIRNIDTLYDIYLIDHYRKDSLNIRRAGSYGFTIQKSDTASYGAGRFELFFRRNPAYAYQLLSFTAEKIARSPYVQLTWKTHYDVPYINFTVERSTDGGKTFTIAGGMTGSGAESYGLVDKGAAIGTNIYRLKQEDVNNVISYSKAAEVQLTNTDMPKISVFPNPASNNINLAVNAGQKSSLYHIRIISSSGSVVREIATPQPNWSGNVAALEPGFYQVQVKDAAGQTLIGVTSFIKN